MFILKVGTTSEIDKLRVQFSIFVLRLTNLGQLLNLVQRGDTNIHPSNLEGEVSNAGVKGILHQKNFYRLNLIFWIVMGCGIAHFGRRGLKTTET